MLKVKLRSVALSSWWRAFSLSIATATTSPAKIDQKNAVRPSAPIPQGFCLPPYGRC